MPFAIEPLHGLTIENVTQSFPEEAFFAISVTLTALYGLLTLCLLSAVVHFLVVLRPLLEARNRKSATRKVQFIAFLLPFCVCRTLAHTLVARSQTLFEFVLSGSINLLGIWFFFCVKLVVVSTWFFLASPALRPSRRPYIITHALACALYLCVLVVSAVGSLSATVELWDHDCHARPYQELVGEYKTWQIFAGSSVLLASSAIMLSFAISALRIRAILRKSMEIAPDITFKLQEHRKRIRNVAVTCIFSFFMRICLWCVVLGQQIKVSFICADTGVPQYFSKGMPAAVVYSLIPFYFLMELLPTLVIIFIVYQQVLGTVTPSLTKDPGSLGAL